MQQAGPNPSTILARTNLHLCPSVLPGRRCSFIEVAWGCWTFSNRLRGDHSILSSFMHCSRQLQLLQIYHIKSSGASRFRSAYGQRSPFTQQSLKPLRLRPHSHQFGMQMSNTSSSLVDDMTAFGSHQKLFQLLTLLGQQEL